MSIKLTNATDIEAQRLRLKLASPENMHEGIDALCRMALYALEHQAHGEGHRKPAVCPHPGCKGGYVYDSQGCYPMPCPACSGTGHAPKSAEPAVCPHGCNRHGLVAHFEPGASVGVYELCPIHGKAPIPSHSQPAPAKEKS